jgi:hypothetical protein
MGLKTKNLLDIVTSICGVFLILPGLIIMFGGQGQTYMGAFLLAFGLFTMPHVRDRILPKLGRKSYSWKGVGISLIVLFVGLGAAGITDSVNSGHEVAAQAEEDRLVKEKAEKLHQEKVAEWNKSGTNLIKEADAKLVAGDYSFANQIVRKYAGIGGDELSSLEARAGEVEIEELSKSARKIPEAAYGKKIAAYQRLVKLDPQNAKFQSALKKYQEARRIAQQKAAEAERLKKIQNLLAKAKTLPVEPYEPNLEVYKQLSSLDPSNKTYRAKVKTYQSKIERKKKVEGLFSKWDGSYAPLKKYVKEKMNDPSSFDHVETKFSDRGNHVYIIMTFRGKNAFGGTIINKVTAKVEFEGNNQTYTILSWD